jgi:DNA-binding MarR family transcriptional regulator
MSDPTPDEVAQRAMHIFPLMGRLLEAQMRSRDDSLSPVHFHVLRLVAQQPRSLSSLAEQQSVSAASMSKTVTVMEERGWLTRTRDTDDRRFVLIDITDEGRDTLHSITSHTRQYLSETIQHLPPDDLKALNDGMRVLIQTFSDVLTQHSYQADVSDTDTTGRPHDE